jgi:hypothetical protein
MAVQVKQEWAVEARSKAPFDPDRLAYLEVGGWRAYYDRKWPRMLRFMLQMMREQFGLSWPRSVQAAYYMVRASAAWAPVDHNTRVVRRNLRKFYRTVVLHGANFRFDPIKVAELEYRYWDVHRRLSGRPESAKGPLIQSFVDLHSALFGLPANAVKESAVGRARSADTVDLITSKRSRDVEGDWHRAEEYLREAYRSLAVQF